MLQAWKQWQLPGTPCGRRSTRQGECLVASLTVQETAVAGGERQSGSYFRRRASRVATGEDLYTFWSCDGREGLSRIRDLSLSGLFIESPVEQEVGAPMKLDFLAEEGPIRANAAVCYVKPGRGVGLKLIAIHQQDFERFAGLIQSKRTKAEACCTSEVQQ